MAGNLRQQLAIYEKNYLLYEEESIFEYCRGGYHPVTLSDYFQEGRYQVRHKLGHGGYATVWLVRDTEEGRWAALKITKADARRPCNELRVLRSLQSRLPGATESAHIGALLDDFIHEGPNGNHQCLVFELLGPSLGSLLRDMDDNNLWASGSKPLDCIDPEHILRLSKQLLEALASIHEVGFCHGDLSPANIVFTCTQSALFDDNKKIFDILGKPETCSLKHIDGSSLSPEKPTQIVQTPRWNWVDEDEEDFRLIDFGEAFSNDNPPNTLAQPFDLRAPETFFLDTYDIDYRVDLWSAGLVIYSTIFFRLEFDSREDERDFAKSIIMAIGETERIPDSWREQLEPAKKKRIAQSKKYKRQAVSANKGHSQERTWDEFKRQVKDCKWRLDRKFKEANLDEELNVLLPVMQGLLKLRREDRIEAREALAMINSGVTQSDYEDDCKEDILCMNRRSRNGASQ
jgi:serine/threonine-protein kinase SRPK3